MSVLIPDDGGILLVYTLIIGVDKLAITLLKSVTRVDGRLQRRKFLGVVVLVVARAWRKR